MPERAAALEASGTAPLVVIGDALLDRDLVGRCDRLAPDAPVPVVSDCEERLRPGGAALAAYLAALGGRDVTLVAAVGDDPASLLLRELLAPWVHLVPLPLRGALAEKTRILAAGHPVARLDRGDGRAGGATEEARAALASASAVLVSDYGLGAPDAVRGVLRELAPDTPVVWDPHPRGGPPVPGTSLVTPTADEARRFAGGGPSAAASSASPGAAAGHAAELVRLWAVEAVAVTLGSTGALLVDGGHPQLVPVQDRHPGDACGAGDRFAVSAAGLLGDGLCTADAVRGAVAAATRYVAGGGASGLAPAGRAVAGGRPPGAAAASGTAQDLLPEEAAVADVPAGGPAPGTARAQQVIAQARGAGGTVVATGGCFDLLHAGHVGLLEAARQAGDCLVVCLNSDDSVRRRKGPGRPIVPLADRVRVLSALECVDAVAVFEEDTPEAVLAELRPDIWIKGGDYVYDELPEAALLKEWGGQVLLLPYLEGRSSTGLARRAARCSQPGEP